MHLGCSIMCKSLRVCVHSCFAEKLGVYWDCAASQGQVWDFYNRFFDNRKGDIMFRYMKKHSILALLALCISIITQITTPVSAVLEQNMIDSIVQGDMESFQKMLWYVALIALGTGVAYYLRALTENKFKARFTEDLRNDLYDGIMRKRPACFQERDTAEYISMINNDVETLTTNFSSPIWTLAGVGFSTVFSLIVMLLYSPLLTGVAVSCSVLSFLVPMIFTKQVKKKLVEKTVYEADLSVRLKEALNGHDVISAFGVFSQIRIRFAEANKALTNSYYKFTLLLSGLENCSAVMGKVIKFITFLIAGGMAMRGQISIGTVILFVSLYGFFSSGIMLFSQCIPLLRGSKPIIDKLTAIIDDRDDTFIGSKKPTFSHEIRIAGLGFQYKEGFPVLTGCDLTIQKREKLALVGASGCGKSTFIKLLSGNYSDYDGGIYYDDVELRELDIQKLRETITIIHQKTHIFNDTIRYNICLGEEFAEKDFNDALRLSGVDRFLTSIAGGVDGQCGEDGANLSGGQKQRIALARALVRGIDFLILDEGVSAIDVETANEIEKELLDMENLTLLTITHRIKDGLLGRYDRVLTLDGGRISGAGV